MDFERLCKILAWTIRYSLELLIVALVASLIFGHLVNMLY